MSAGDGDLGLRVLDRAGSSTERNSQPLKAGFELETREVERLGRLAEIDPLVQVGAEHLGFEKIGTVGPFSGGAKGKGAQKPVVESIQKDDALLTPVCNDGELSFLHPVEDLSGPLGQVGGGDNGSRHRRDLFIRIPHSLRISQF